MIGLGKMGLPMARHLCKRLRVAGFDVSDGAWSRRRGRRQGRPIAQAVAAASDLVIIVVGFDPEVEPVIFGDHGVLQRRAAA